MHISWSFLDKKKGAIDAIEAYPQMDFIIRHTDEDIAKEQAKMISTSSMNLDGMPHAFNPQAAEDRIIEGIAEIDVLKERYRQAVEYMNWFRPAWDKLTEDDRYVLTAFFLDERTGCPVDIVADHFGIERTSAYSKRKRAIERITNLLYGKD